MTCGIYLLKFEGLDQVYIGQSVDIEARYNGHIFSLIHNRGASKKLYDAYKLYGLPTMSILEICTSELLDAAEISWISEFDSLNNGLNTVTGGRSYTGYLAPGSKYSKLDILKVFKLLCSSNLYSTKYIAEILDVHISLVSGITNSWVHLWLEEHYPNKYKCMLANNSLRIEKAKLYRTSKAIGKLCNSIISPSGEVFKDISNIRQFARENNLDSGALNKLINNKCKSHKGWKIYNGS